MNKRKEKIKQIMEEFSHLNLIEQFIQGIVIIQDFRIVCCNDAFAGISGYSIEELLSLSPQKVERMVHPEHRALVWGRMRDRLLGNEAEPRYEYKGVKKDGSEVWLEMVASRIEHNGKPAIHGAIIDITDRKAAEQALYESRSNLSALIENIQGVIWSVDRDFRILSFNSFFKKMAALAFDIELDIGIKITEYIPPHLKEKWIERYSRAFKGESFSFEEDYALAGQTFSAEISLTPINNNGEITGASVFGRDITASKKAEKALHESEEKYRAIFESFFDVYFRTDKEGLVTLISPSVLAQAGWEPEEVIGNPVTDFYRDPEERDAFRKKLKEKGVINDYELKLLAKDGRVIDVSLSAKIILGTDGSPVGVEGVLRDITDRKKVEAQVNASLQEKEVLLQEIHHRVKNNMQIISSLLNLQSRQIEDQYVKNMFQMSRDRIRSMALIHEKLYQSKDLASINFAQYIQSLTVHLMHTYNDKVNSVHLKTEVDNVFLDINRAIPCGLIINELVSNSLKHGFPEGKKGEILVKLHSNNNGNLMLEISDTGVGFPDNLNFRSPVSLGLQLVHDLVNQLGGILELDRTAGTAYKIAFNKASDTN